MESALRGYNGSGRREGLGGEGGLRWFSLYGDSNGPGDSIVYGSLTFAVCMCLLSSTVLRVFRSVRRAQKNDRMTTRSY